MASGDLYEVERIVDKRKNKKGKWEYLIRWKGYGSSEDTWEPEHHLLHCEEFIDQFNALHIHKDRRPKQSKHGSSKSRLFSRAGDNEAARSHAEPRKKRRTSATGPERPRKVGGSKQASDRVAKSVTYRAVPGELQFVPIRRPHNGLQNGDMDPLHYRDATRAHKIPNSRADEILEEFDSREAPIMNELGSALSNGGINLPTSVKRKLVEEKGYVFDKRLRYNIRQSESNCRFRDIVVRKEDGFTHVLLSSQTSDNNALTPEIMKEVSRALGNAAADDSKLLLLSAVGSVFCSGLDRTYLIGRLSNDRRKES
ncbi:hypothetical protein AGOR_G00003250, partial [Albula goreensis]